jgi:hypothetical protein
MRKVIAPGKSKPVKSSQCQINSQYFPKRTEEADKRKLAIENVSVPE